MEGYSLYWYLRLILIRICLSDAINQQKCWLNALFHIRNDTCQSKAQNTISAATPASETSKKVHKASPISNQPQLNELVSTRFSVFSLNRINPPRKKKRTATNSLLTEKWKKKKKKKISFTKKGAISCDLRRVKAGCSTAESWVDAEPKRELKACKNLTQDKQKHPDINHLGGKTKKKKKKIESKPLSTNLRASGHICHNFEYKQAHLCVGKTLIHVWSFANRKRH